MIFLNILITILLPSTLAVLLDPANCGSGPPCGPTAACCPSDYLCNFNIGIPACEIFESNIVSGSDGALCADPYFNDCSFLASGSATQGYCCPIGTICFHDVTPNILSCIDAYGNLTAPSPSTTVGVVPPATLVENSNSKVNFSPPSAWSSTSTAPNCTSGSDLRVTSTINSTVSFNYTGPSVGVHTVTSQHGGVLSVSVDGFDTGETIDTFSNGSDHLPICFPKQFPPFLHPPPGLATRSAHRITLTYVGPSPNAPNTTALNDVQFGSFFLPDFQPSPTNSGSAIVKGRAKLTSLTFGVLTMATYYVVLS